MDNETESGAGAPGALGAAGVAGKGGTGGTGGAGGTGLQGIQGIQGEPGKTGANHTAVVVQQTRFTPRQRAMILVGGGALIVVTVLALVLSLWTIRNESTQITALRTRALNAEAISKGNVDLRKNVLCVYLAKIDTLAAVSVLVNLQSPTVTPEQRATLQPFAVVAPLPKECKAP